MLQLVQCGHGNISNHWHDVIAGDDDDDDADDDEDDEVESKKGKKKGKKMDEKRRDSNASDKSEEGDSKRTNQFSFVERATQTMNNALKVGNWKENKYKVICTFCFCLE